MRIKEENIYTGNIFKCTSYPTAMSNYFIGYGYKEECKLENIKLVKLKDGTYARLEDYKRNGRKALRFATEAKERGDYFVKNIVPLKEQEESSL